MNRLLHALLPTWRFLLLLALLAPLAASATHLVGGELDLQHRIGNTYTLRLNLYFDDVHGDPGALDQELMAGIFAKNNNQRFGNVVLPLTSNTFVDYTDPDCAVGSLRTRKLVYIRDIVLSPGVYNSPAGYYVAVERCCRNDEISNIVAPEAAAQTFYLEFPAVVRNGAAFIDSTPRIFPPLSDYACKNELFYYDFGGDDSDGDSLAYDMVTPLNGNTSVAFPVLPQVSPAPYSLITWKPGLGTDNQIPGTPPLRIDARTGRLTVQPADTGLFVFGVRCTEYRNGQKIGETRRDFQLKVLICPTNSTPQMEVRTSASPAAYLPGRDTLRLVPGGNRCLTIRFTDPDPNSVLTMSSRPVNFSANAPLFTTTRSGTVRAAGAPDTLTATLCFPECTDSQGKVFLLDVIVADNGCSLPRRDTVRVAFIATQPPNAPPLLTTSFPAAPVPPAPLTPVVIRVPIGTRYSATLAGTDADGHALALTAAGQGFDLAARRMVFAAQNGTGQADATFAWEPTCDDVTADGLLVRFRLAETGPCTPRNQERLVRFQVVPLEEPVAFRPPNVITPNGDTKNDVLTMPDLPVDFCDQRFAGIQIFTRWGQRVYQSPERTFRWGGAGAGGVYYYLVTYTDGRKFKGWVEVIQ
ncbi:gliding motility-associated C-terminal domain-containing protein [Hymenobacter sp. BT683]|uniref:Gliding motility-associated C-terminal domain-containing protein n=1 Tax=Hymenobacter jeongseonensis TaxID=2791027 RepID=A0ABS0IJU0_9BACT|nr:gliding motility-associated C-terminal domain-containing protein [Hymenobacter jeongseonensis]MBF9238637.1 gliding motility-associated C-terminal domain-containing protein [Hymenobacter jeongseonensis]